MFKVRWTKFWWSDIISLHVLLCILVAPMRGRGFGRGMMGGNRHDPFRSRPANTSRPPSMHVDDFVKMETQQSSPSMQNNNRRDKMGKGMGMAGGGMFRVSTYFLHFSPLICAHYSTRSKVSKLTAITIWIDFWHIRIFTVLKHPWKLLPIWKYLINYYFYEFFFKIQDFRHTGFENAPSTYYLRWHYFPYNGIPL